MVITTHTLYGIITQRIINKRPLLTGIVSHLIIDKIPHLDYNYKTNKKLLYLDFLLAQSLLFLLAKNKDEIIAGTSAYAVDIGVVVSNRIEVLNFISNLHYKNHTTKELKSKKIGFLQQFILSLIAIIYLIVSK